MLASCVHKALDLTLTSDFHLQRVCIGQREREQTCMCVYGGSSWGGNTEDSEWKVCFKEWRSHPVLWKQLLFTAGEEGEETANEGRNPAMEKGCVCLPQPRLPLPFDSSACKWNLRNKYTGARVSAAFLWEKSDTLKTEFIVCENPQLWGVCGSKSLFIWLQ